MQYVCHAEMNAILNTNTANCKNCTVFIVIIILLVICFFISLL